MFWSKYKYERIKVVGVTFSNGKTSRQTILRKMKFRDGEFKDNFEMSIQKYQYDGKDAYGVYANEQQIGNIPANKVEFITNIFDRIESISNVDVVGGGTSENGDSLSFGAEITLKVRK